MAQGWAAFGSACGRHHQHGDADPHAYPNTRADHPDAHADQRGQNSAHECAAFPNTHHRRPISVTDYHRPVSISNHHRAIPNPYRHARNFPNLRSHRTMAREKPLGSRGSKQSDFTL